MAAVQKGVGRGQVVSMETCVLWGQQEAGNPPNPNPTIPGSCHPTQGPW